MAVVIAASKFLSGVWIVIILIPLLILMFLGIHRHYQHVERERITEIPLHPQDIHHRLSVPITHLNRASNSAKICPTHCSARSRSPFSSGPSRWATKKLSGGTTSEAPALLSLLAIPEAAEPDFQVDMW